MADVKVRKSDTPDHDLDPDEPDYWYAVCVECDWIGPIRGSAEEAEDDGADHPVVCGLSGPVWL